MSTYYTTREEVRLAAEFAAREYVTEERFGPSPTFTTHADKCRCNGCR